MNKRLLIIILKMSDLGSKVAAGPGQSKPRVRGACRDTTGGWVPSFLY